MADKKIKVTLKKSMIGATERQKRVVKALGLSRIDQVVEHNDSDVINGMVNKISHMVSVEK
ncbi:MAG: 50S ribosomal protein L30 [bacterium]